jgi:hypothetical protein
VHVWAVGLQSRAAAWCGRGPCGIDWMWVLRRDHQLSAAGTMAGVSVVVQRAVALVCNAPDIATLDSLQWFRDAVMVPCMHSNGACLVSKLLFVVCSNHMHLVTT